MKRASPFDLNRAPLGSVASFGSRTLILTATKLVCMPERPPDEVADPAANRILAQKGDSVVGGEMIRRHMAIFLVELLFAACATGQTLSAHDTRFHVGQSAEVCGTITDEYYARPAGSGDEAQFIHLDGYDSFRITTWYKDHAKVGRLPVAGHLCVKGLIRTHQPEDLIVFEPCPKTGLCTYHHGKTASGTEIVLNTSTEWYVSH